MERTGAPLPTAGSGVPGITVQDNTDQTNNGYTIEEKHKSPEQMIIISLPDEVITFKKITISQKQIWYFNYSHAILDQEIQDNGGCPEAAGPDRFLQPRKYQKYPHRSWLVNWLWAKLWALIVKIQGYCYLKYREYLQELYSLDTWCLTEQTNVLRSNTTSNRINHAACQI